MTVMQPGDKVQILYPEYAAGKTGAVLEKETLEDGTKTGYWLVQTEGDDEIFALKLQEVKVLTPATDSL